MKDMGRPAKRIFSQNKEGETFVKSHKSAVEKTLALIAVESGNSSKKRKLAEADEKKEREKKEAQIATDATNNAEDEESEIDTTDAGIDESSKQPFLDGEDAKENDEDSDDDEDAIKDEETENTLKIKSKTNKISKDVIHKELIQPPKKISKKKSVKFDPSTKSDEIPTLPGGKKSLYYEVETSLKEAFTSSIEQPFSLLASFANPDVPVEAELSSDDEETHPQEDNESSNDEEFETGNGPWTDDGTAPYDLETEVEHPDKTFFFMPDGERLTEGVKKFHRTLEEEEMWRQWKDQRKQMKLLFHTRQKHIIRRLNYKKSAVFKNKSSKKN